MVPPERTDLEIGPKDIFKDPDQEPILPVGALLAVERDPWSCPWWWCSSVVAEPLAKRALHMAP